MARLRAVVVVAVVLVLGAWSCQVPTDSAGSAGSADVPISTTGLTALVAGEDWHYVGDGTTGLGTTFLNSWANNVVGDTALAFRIRESGVVDFAGTIKGGTSAPIFTLPSGYRPSTNAPRQLVQVETNTGSILVAQLSIETSGNFAITPVPATTSFVHLNGQFFLTPPAAA